MFWVKRWACHFFDLVDRKDHALIWERRREAEERFASLVTSFDTLSNNFTRLSIELERERKTVRELALDRAIINVGPIEAMDRTLQYLLGGDYEKAISELEHGLKLVKGKVESNGGGTEKWKLAF